MIPKKRVIFMIAQDFILDAHPGSQCKGVETKYILVVSLNLEIRDLSLGLLEKLKLVCAESQSGKRHTEEELQTFL